MFARRLRAPSVLLWIVGLILAALVGLAIAGPPGGAEDVPLRDRGVPEAETGCGPEDVTCYFGSTTTSTAPGSTGSDPTTGPSPTSPSTTSPSTTTTSTTSTTAATEETAPADTESTTTEGSDE